MNKPAQQTDANKFQPFIFTDETNKISRHLFEQLYLMNDISFRRLTATDHSEYRRVRLNCLTQYPDNFGHTYEEEIAASASKLSQAVQHPDPFNFAFGAFDAQKLVGICGFVTEPRIKTRHRGEIVQMFVDEQYKGHGIGKKLLQLCIDAAFANKQIEQITLSVVASNEQAIKLYRNAGFKEYGSLENYFKSGHRYFTQLFFCLWKPAS